MLPRIEGVLVEEREVVELPNTAVLNCDVAIAPTRTEDVVFANTVVSLCEVDDALAITVVAFTGRRLTVRIALVGIST